MRRAGLFFGVKTILVPIDFSSATASTVRAAGDLAVLHGDKIVLLHVAVLPVIYEPYGMGANMLLDATLAAEEAAKKQLKRWTARVAERQIPASWELRQGRPADAIVEESGGRDIHYVVIGSHGHGAVYELFVGSTTQEVLRRVRCPVVVVPPPSRGRATRKSVARRKAK